jgi:hypothetical protein
MARTSPYGDLLQGIPGAKMPEWVFGGEFGDIENDIIRTEFGRRQSEARALQNDQLEFDLDKARRNRDFQDELAGVFEQNKPATMRDMYRVGAEQALGQGRADIAFQMQDKLDELDRQEKQRKLQDTQLALSIGKMNPDEAARMNPQIFSPDVVARMKKEAELEMARAARLARGDDTPKPDKGKNFIVDNAGKIDVVPDSELRQKIQEGWRPATAEFLKQVNQNLEAQALQQEAKPGGWTIFAAEPTPVPSAEAQRGGSARPQAAALPPPGAVVQQVIRRRTQENKGK